MKDIPGDKVKFLTIVAEIIFVTIQELQQRTVDMEKAGREVLH